MTFANKWNNNNTESEQKDKKNSIYREMLSKRRKERIDIISSLPFNTNLLKKVVAVRAMIAF